MEISKPDYTYLWSSGGAVVAPSNVKIQTGWTAEVPPFQWENWSQNRQDQAISHILQKGISVWSSTGEYYFTTSGERSYVQGSDGNIYVAVADSVGQNPVTDTTDAYWTLALVTPQNKGFSLLTNLSSGSGNYTVPAGVFKIFYRVWGAGGGGGAGGGVGAGTSGGGGGYSEGWLAVVPGQLIPYIVGAGGAGGASSGLGGASGGSSTFNTTIISGGGAGGGGGGPSGGGGGSASGGNFNIAGGSGNNGTAFNPAATLQFGVPGGQTYGTPASLVGGSNGVGVAGLFPGGGGGSGAGGSVGGSIGAAGAAGLISLWG